MLTKISNPIILLIFIILSIICYTSLSNAASRREVAAANVQLLRESVDAQKLEVSELRTDLEIANHPFTKEKMLRDELLLQKEGEIVFKLPDIPEVSPSPTPTPTPVTPWVEWKEVLFE